MKKPVRALAVVPPIRENVGGVKMHSVRIAKRGAFCGVIALTFFALSMPNSAVAQPGNTNTKAGDPKVDDKKKDPPSTDPKTDPAADPKADPKTDPTTDPKADPPANGTPGANGTPNPTGAPGAGAGENAGAPVPINLRLRSLEQRVQALKERAWRAKARVGMLKEAVLGGGIGARATLVHKNKMGGSFRLIKLIYALDGTQIFARTSDSGTLPKTLDVLTGPIAPGSHTISVFAIYRGHGYGVFKYLNKYRFRVRSSHTFTASEGKDTRIEVVGFERGGSTTPLEKRPAVDFKVTQSRGGGK